MRATSKGVALVGTSCCRPSLAQVVGAVGARGLGCSAKVGCSISRLFGVAEARSRAALCCSKAEVVVGGSSVCGWYATVADKTRNPN